MVEYKRPLGVGTSATDGLYTYCHIVDVDTTNKIAHVVDQLGNPRQVSTTRSMGKSVEPPRTGEDWIITRQYGDWLFAVCINSLAVSAVPAGGSATSILTKVSNTDYDMQWALPVTGPTANTVPIRDASGRMQAADPSAAQDVASKNYVDTVTVPSGVIHQFAGSAAPSGYVLCDGASYLRTSFGALFAVIGTTYGAADGTHFNVPDLRTRVPVGKNSSGTFTSLGATGGAETHAHALTAAGVASHSHTLASGTVSAHSHPLSDNGGAQIVIGVGSGAFTRRTATVTSWTAAQSIATAGGSVSQAETTGAGLFGNTDSATPTLSGSSGTATPGLTGSTDSGSSLQPYIVVNHIIKT